MANTKQPFITGNVLNHPRNGRPGVVEPGGGPPHDGDMSERVAKLEERLDSLLPSLSTKADVEGVRTDVHKGQSEMKTWMIATIFTLLLGLFTIGTFMSNNVRAIVTDARPTQPVQPAQAPIIIQLPAQATTGHAPLEKPAPQSEQKTEPDFKNPPNGEQNR